MAGSDKKDSGIPDWQRRPSSTTTPSEQPQPESETSREELLAQASTFLEDESIKNASTDRKIAFLESKGLRNDEIEKLLGISRNVTATSETMTEKTSSPEKDSTVTDTSDTQPSSSEIGPNSGYSTSSSSSTSTASTRDIPPVITYPEFLLHQPKPPLITFRNVLYAIYGAAGVGASIYGASEFLIKPMVRTLTVARHELAQTAEENLIKLNEKLEQNVSQIPQDSSYKLLSQKPKHTTATEDGNEAPTPADTDSITSDPTELYHRDIATQTSPDLDHEPTPATGTSALNDDTDTTSSASKSVAAIRTHSSRLDLIAFQLRQCLEDDKRSKVAEDSVINRISDLQKYLDGLAYNTTPSYLGSVFNMTAAGSAGRNSKLSGEDDAIAGFRAEIRGIKGALLSAKNFPSGRSAGRSTAAFGLGRSAASTTN